MASEQIEYCGMCEHYEQCKALRSNGQFNYCLVNEEK